MNGPNNRMHDGEVIARHYTTREPVRLRWQGGRVTEVARSSIAPPENLWLAPPLVDVQVNGYAGVDFQRDDLTADQLLTAVRGLRASGCTRILLTLITDEWPRLMSRLRALKELRDASPELQHAIAGWHVEGPFLSSEPGFRGAHNPEVMRDPSPGDIAELRRITGNDPLLLTVAPERNGCLAAIQEAVACGINISLGHTNAAATVMAGAVQAGATGFTHLANGCPQQLDRHDNIVWRVFETPGLTVGIIPDRIHVSPALFRVAHRLLKRDRIYYTTDAMAAAGAPPGRYSIGRVEVEVGADQVVRMPGKTNFAGSALRPLEGIFRSAEMLGCAWQETWDHLSLVPAKFMHLPHFDFSPESLAGQPGAPGADFCLLRTSSEQLPEQLHVYVNGECVADSALPLQPLTARTHS